MNLPNIRKFRDVKETRWISGLWNRTGAGCLAVRCYIFQSHKPPVKLVVCDFASVCTNTHYGWLHMQISVTEINCLVKAIRNTFIELSVSIFGWSHALFLPEGSAEDTFTGKTGCKADFFDRQSWVLQKILCGIDSCLQQVLIRGLAGLFFEYSWEIIRA